jgi:hypothetical protein
MQVNVVFLENSFHCFKIINTTVGPYYPLGTIDTVPRAYDILGPTKEWKREKIKIKK